MRSWKQMAGWLKLAIAATLIAVTVIAGAVASERFGGANDDAVQARETGRAAENPADEGRDSEKTLELGTMAKISPNYRVAVTEVTRYEVPTGLLLAATIEATYIGTEDGEPWADFSVEYFGAGSRTFGESDCPFARGDLDPSSQPTLQTGDEARYAVCIDLPVKSIKDSKILVEEAFSTDDRTFWSTDGAVTKPLPAPLPTAPPQRARASQPQQADNNDGRSNPGCENFDDEKFEEFKEKGEEFKEHIAAYKDAGGDDEDTLEEFEEWEEDYDERLDRLQEWAEAC